MDDGRSIYFENRFDYTAKLLRPVYWEMMAWRRYLYAAWLLLALTGLFTLQTTSGDIPALLLILLFISVAGMSLPILQAKAAERNFRKLMNGETPETIVYYTDTEIIGHEARNEYHYQYSQIRRVHSTRHLWLLMIDRRIALIVRKEGFTAGCATDFPAFIRSKCPGIKGKFN